MAHTIRILCIEDFLTQDGEKVRGAILVEGEAPAARPVALVYGTELMSADEMARGIVSAYNFSIVAGG